jgi:hypothetical protein
MADTQECRLVAKLYKFCIPVHEIIIQLSGGVRSPSPSESNLPSQPNNIAMFYSYEEAHTQRAKAHRLWEGAEDEDQDQLAALRIMTELAQTGGDIQAIVTLPNVDNCCWMELGCR